MAFKLLTTQWPVIQGRWQTEAIVDQHLLTRTVSIVHSLDLPHGHVALINHNQKIIWEEVEKSIRRLSFASSVHVTRVVFNAVCIAHLTEHLDIILCTLFQTLSFKEFTFLLKNSQLLLQLSLNLGNGHFHMVVIGHEVSGWENGQVVHIS